MIKTKYTSAITDTPWWLAGGIPRDACVAAYQPVGASDYASSKVNLSNPGVLTLIDGAAFPTWSSAGWYFAASGSVRHLKFGENISIRAAILSLSHLGTGGYRGCFDNTGGTDAIRFYSTTAWMGNANANTSDFVWSGGAFYVDGELTDVAKANGVRHTICATAPQNETATFTIGHPVWGNREWYGHIYAAAVYTVVPTQLQVTALTNAMNAL